MEESNSSRWTTGGGGAGAAPRPPLSPDLTGSYLQVVVEKHNRKKEPAARVATASSPVRTQERREGAGAAGDAWPRGAVLVAPAAGWRTLFAPAAYYADEERAADECGARIGCTDEPNAQVKKYKSWHIFRESELYRSLPVDDEEEGAEPECVEVYRFERVGASLSSGAAARGTHVARRSARAARAARAAAAEAGAAARLVAGVPLLGALLALRCVLQLARDVVSGAVLAASDYVLKPALALAFNAVLHPLLVFAGNVAGGVRAAARPACGAAAECAAAAAGLLRAARLVEVHACACACRATAPGPAP